MSVGQFREVLAVRLVNMRTWHAIGYVHSSNKLHSNAHTCAQTQHKHVHTPTQACAQTHTTQACAQAATKACAQAATQACAQAATQACAQTATQACVHTHPHHTSMCTHTTQACAHTRHKHVHKQQHNFTSTHTTQARVCTAKRLSVIRAHMFSNSVVCSQNVYCNNKNQNGLLLTSSSFACNEVSTEMSYVQLTGNRLKLN